MQFASSFLLFTLFTFSLVAQTPDPPALKGKKALQFSFDGFRVGGGLGGKYWLADLLALRTTLRFSNTSSESDQRIAGDPNSYISNDEDTFLSLETSLHHAFFQTEDVIPYAGGGAEIRYSMDTREQTTRSGTHMMTRYRHSSVRLFLLIGAELWITPRFSFSAEQTLGISSQSYGYGYYSSTIDIRNGTSQLLFAFYF